MMQIRAAAMKSALAPGAFAPDAGVVRDFDILFSAFDS